MGRPRKKYNHNLYHYSANRWKVTCVIKQVEFVNKKVYGWTLYSNTWHVYKRACVQYM